MLNNFSYMKTIESGIRTTRNVKDYCSLNIVIKVNNVFGWIDEFCDELGHVILKINVICREDHC